MIEPLKHEEVAKKTDEALRDEARAHLAKTPKLQIVAELLDKLRRLALPWWSPQRLRGAFPSPMRMGWFAERADLRQSITHELTGLAPKAARRLAPEAQASLIDAVIDCGDIECERFEAAFDPKDLVVYGPVVALWRQFRENMVWEAQTRPHQDLAAWLIRIVLADKSDAGMARKPLLTPWEVRSAIDPKVWHTMLPLDVRVAIDEARLARERTLPREPFLARNELEIVTPEIMTSHIPLRELHRIFVVAEKALGFEPSTPHVTTTALKLRPATLPPPPRDSGVVSRATPPPSRQARALDAMPTPAFEESDIVFDDILLNDAKVAV